MNDLRIIMYHYIHKMNNNDIWSNLKALDISEFESQLKYFHSNNTIITMEKLIDVIVNNDVLPENSVLLTFDDGYMDHYSVVFPLLKKYNMQGSFFIPGQILSSDKLLLMNRIQFLLASSDIVTLNKELLKEIDNQRRNYPDLFIDSIDILQEKYYYPGRLDSAEIMFFKRVLQLGLPSHVSDKITIKMFNHLIDVPEKEISKNLYLSTDLISEMHNSGMFFGVHGYSHTHLTSISLSKSKKDILNAKSAMSKWINPNSWVINYPFGDTNADIIDFCHKNGAIVGLGTQRKVCNLSSDNNMLLPRIDCIYLTPNVS